MNKRDVATIIRTAEVMAPVLARQSRVIDQAAEVSKLLQTDGVLSCLDQAARAAAAISEAMPPTETVRAIQSMAEALSRGMDPLVSPGSSVLPDMPEAIFNLPVLPSAPVLPDLPESILKLPVPSPPPVVLDSLWESGDPVAEPLPLAFADPSERTERLEISDDVLRRRCLDLLSAPGDFDRAVNQALTVLEDRVRRTAGLEKTVIGRSLMSKAFSPAGPIVLSGVSAEQVGWRYQFDGIHAALRNPTSHGIVEAYGRDDAVAVVLYVDFLLRRLERSTEWVGDPARFP